MYTLVQSFGQMVRKRDQHRLQDWMKQVAESRFREVQRFAQGLQRDKEEVLVRIVDEIRRHLKICFAAFGDEKELRPSNF